LEQADILILFPIRTLDFGAKGGEKTNTMLSKNNEEKSNNKATNDCSSDLSTDNNTTSKSA
jgi:small conductance mechanosensitive channel